MSATALICRAAAILLLGTSTMPVGAQAPAPSHIQAGPDETERYALGRAQYARTCAQCHGFNMVNYGNTTYDLRKFPLDQEARFQISVHMGKNNMPAFGPSLSDEQINLIWVYVKHRGKAPEAVSP